MAVSQDAKDVLFRSREVSQILDISRRQLQYWAQTDLVTPSVQTNGGHYRYAFQDLVSLKATKRLIDSGVSLQRIRKSISALRNLLPSITSPLSELVSVATGDVVLVFRDNAVFEAITGQEWVLEVATFQKEIDEWRAGVEVLNAAKKKSRVLKAYPLAGKEGAENTEHKQLGAS